MKIDVFCFDQNKMLRGRWLASVSANLYTPPLFSLIFEEKHFYLHKLVKCDILYTLTFTHIVEL